jgi:hypothetical protein
MRDALVDLHYGLIAPDAERATREHVAACPACAAELENLRLLTGALRPDEAFTKEGQVDWDLFARTTVRRALRGDGVVVPFARLRRFLAMPARPVWAAAAASLVFVVGLGLITGRLPIPYIGPQAPVPAGEPEAQVLVPQVNLDNLTVNLARQNTAEYLRQTRAVLVTLLDVNVHCDKGEGRVDVSAERAKASELLRRQRLIAAELHRMPLARAQDVCNDLERLLLEVASLTDCTRDEEIQTLRDQIEKRQIFVRMELLGQELTRAEVPRA